ncbi:MAG: secretin N-terminal domain-containing protein [Sedimentisphaerales bacterium]
MVTERQIQGRWRAKVVIFICAVTVVLSGSFLFAAEQETASVAARYRVFSLKHISAEQGKKYLAQAGVGTVSQLPGVNALLVTAQPEDLIKASAILELVDSEEPFDIKTITAASEIANFPPNGQIAAKVGDVSIGTFSNPPSGTAKTKAIIDVHNDAVIAVAPVGQLEKIISAIEQLRSSKAQALQGAKPNKSAEVNEVSGAKTETVTENELEKAKVEAEAELKRIAALPAEESSKAGPQEAAGQANTESNEPNELFDKLLNSIARTEKEPILQKEGEMKTEETAVEKQTQQLSQPNAVAPALAAQAVAGVPETNGPNSVDLKQAEESSPPATEEPQSTGHLTVEPNLAAVGISETNEAAEEPESEPNAVPKVHSYEPAPIADGNEMLELDLPAKLNIIDLVDLVGKYLQLDYMYDETQVKGEVSLKLQGPIKVKDLYPLLESVLKFRGFVMTRRGNLVTIVPAGEAVGIDPVLHPEAGEVRLGDVVITRVFKLKHIDTASAQNLLNSMKLGTNISPIPETGTLIITEYAYRMARIEELLEMIDQPGAPRQFRFRQLKYTMATTLAPKIKALAEQLGTISITIAAPTTAASPARPARGRAAPAPTPTAPTPAAAPSSVAKPAVYLDADERTNRILMIGLEEQLIVVDSLIDSLDVEQQDLRTLRLYDIQHVGAEEVVKKLQELGVISGGTTTGGRITAGAKPSGLGAPGTPAPAAAVPAAAAATAETAPLVEQPQVVVIESTNSLLVNATDEQHVRIATIISYVDSETLKRAIPYEIYPLENQKPEDLAEVLQKFIQETIKDKEGKIQQTIKKTEEDIMDKRRPQVLIDVTLVGISEDDAFNYDLQLVSKLPQMASGSILPVLLDPNQYTGTVKGVSSILGSTGSGQGFYADRHIQALLTLMAKKGYGRVLARPKILVNDNEKGHIDTTKTIYIARSASTVYAPTAGGTPVAGTTPISTSFTFDQFPSGIKLDITPHISEGSLLRLELKMTRSNQPPPSSSGPDQPPGDKTEDNVETVVTVPDDSTIILGGIITMDQTKSNWKVPLLGDIPIAGGLFRKVGNINNQTKLYVFVKANILRPGVEGTGLADIRVMSEKNMAGFEAGERDFQTHQDFPGIEPEPVEPLRVLESE